MKNTPYKLSVAAVLNSALICSYLLYASNANADWLDELTESTMVAYKAMVKQMSLSIRQENDSRERSIEAMANAKKQLAYTVQVKDMADQFLAVDQNGSPMGQPPDPCLNNRIAGAYDKASKQADADTKEWIGNLYNSSFKTGVSSSFTILGKQFFVKQNTRFALMSNVEELHRKRFCTQMEQAAGICELTPNGMQAADVDVSSTSKPQTFSIDQQIAATAYANRVAPMQPPPTEIAKLDGCEGISCKMVMAQNRRLDAMRSIARNALLRDIESKTTATRNANSEMGDTSNK